MIGLTIDMPHWTIQGGILLNPMEWTLVPQKCVELKDGYLESHRFAIFIIQYYRPDRINSEDFF